MMIRMPWTRAERNINKARLRPTISYTIVQRTEYRIWRSLAALRQVGPSHFVTAEDCSVSIVATSTTCSPETGAQFLQTTAR